MKTHFSALLAAAATSVAFGGNTVTGEYLEVRSCDVYTGPCFANAEMNLTGKDGLMFWSVREGSWNGVDLSGLGVIAAVRADGTLGNLKFQPRSGEAVIITDSKATSEQTKALAAMAQSLAGSLITKVVNVQSAPIESSIGACEKAGCASLKAGALVQVSTSCMGGKHNVCGNEETFYPPLTAVKDAYPVYTDVASFNAEGLNTRWQLVGTRGAFLGTFSAQPDTKIAAR